MGIRWLGGKGLHTASSSAGDSVNIAPGSLHHYCCAADHVSCRLADLSWKLLHANTVYNVYKKAFSQEVRLLIAISKKKKNYAGSENHSPQ